VGFLFKLSRAIGETVITATANDKSAVAGLLIFINNFKNKLIYFKILI